VVPGRRLRARGHEADVRSLDRYPDISGIRAAESCRARYDYLGNPLQSIVLGSELRRHRQVDRDVDRSGGVVEG
jgi:hypothetical protein